MTKDWTGNKVSYITTNGFANNRDYDRETNDYYATEPKAVEMLLELEDFTKLHVWECACGEGHLSRAMQKKGITVYSSDLINRGFGNQYDFLSDENKEWKGHIITNPPYKYAKEFIEKALSIIPEGCLVAMFLPIRYTEGKARKNCVCRWQYEETRKKIGEANRKPKPEGFGKKPEGFKEKISK